MPQILLMASIDAIMQHYAEIGSKSTITAMQGKCVKYAPTPNIRNIHAH